MCSASSSPACRSASTSLRILMIDRHDGRWQDEARRGHKPHEWGRWRVGCPRHRPQGSLPTTQTSGARAPDAPPQPHTSDTRSLTWREANKPKNMSVGTTLANSTSPVRSARHEAGTYVPHNRQTNRRMRVNRYTPIAQHSNCERVCAKSSHRPDRSSRLNYGTDSR